MKFKSLNEFIDSAEEKDYCIVEDVPGKDGKLYEFKITKRGLDSTWQHFRYTIQFSVDGKKVTTQTFTGIDRLKNFLRINSVI
ncbi:MAG: hypothetical protein WC783_00125 [Candidatus Paceibacterota bacterium]|jgi:hypothetical protein